MRLVNTRANSSPTQCALLAADHHGALLISSLYAFKSSQSVPLLARVVAIFLEGRYPWANFCLVSARIHKRHHHHHSCRHSFLVRLEPNKRFDVECRSAKSVFIHPPTPRLLPRLRPGSLKPGDAMDPRHERTASGAPSMSLGHRACIASETPPGPQCTSQPPHRP